MHVDQDSLDECARLIGWALSLCLEQRCTPVFMGDQFDTHGSVRVEALEFWRWAYSQFVTAGLSPISLVGNHDMNYANTYSSMAPFASVGTVIGKMPRAIEHLRGVYGVGYVKDPKQFVQLINALPADATHVLCHQEFNGARYESGFYAPGGVQLGDIRPGLLFYSGHIHVKQQVGDKVLYVGTPRQIDRSDSDPDKGVWIWRADKTLTFVRTPDSVAPRFVRLVVRDGDPIPTVQCPQKTFVDLVGTSEFVKAAAKRLPEGCKIRTLVESNRTIQRDFKESEGLPSAFGRYVNEYIANAGLTAEQQEKLSVLLRDQCRGLL
jgi:hypothetical protein